MQFEDREQKEEEMVQSRERSEGGVQIDEKVGDTNLYFSAAGH